MASFIGKTISLISQSDIRYRGILHSIDASQATIQLSNVYSMGTETRRPPAEYIPPQPTPYEFILFRAKEVKDLSVDSEPLPSAPAANVHNDPAIIGVSQGAPTGQSYNAFPSAYPNGSAPPAAPTASAPASVPVTAQQEQTPSTPSQHQGKRRDTNGRQNIPNPIRSATASLENVERAMGDLRVSEAARNGRQGSEIQAGNIQVPAADFDFASSNAKFDKSAMVKPVVAESDSDSDTDSDVTNPEDVEAKEKKEREKKEKEEQKGAYNPKRSFFDELTPNTMGGPRGGATGGRGGSGSGRGRGRGRSRREEEAQRNLMTFGEATPPPHANGFTGRRGGRRGGGGGGNYNPHGGVTTGGRPR
ncbi:hypothetical protein M422DRAFT_51910 [Sphaerobolus stellatus SS14]|uniref:DFDF domain-containing protein n=1 Tax=Sphaerobolus stellatus (strain SS14) TaxID=990650 RepID=A0A0C9TWB8_SPHS4|nr:hypothetical protein M422DRAFT_51910 [Sphaerobolus stellatus SS14]